MVVGGYRFVACTAHRCDLRAIPTASLLHNAAKFSRLAL
jgi:hypothetical protein